MSKYIKLGIETRAILLILISTKFQVIMMSLPFKNTEINKRLLLSPQHRAQYVNFHYYFETASLL